ncbi:MAG: FKBP-type peptidyl-prolyl cis-trans isomerase [Phycisphaeraceae bacterium]|nr:FKBP-type peptidyl-prolyl cis-trans isomerase [Phycisphaeraceae bacterium]
MIEALSAAVLIGVAAGCHAPKAESTVRAPDQRVMPVLKTWRLDNGVVIDEVRLGEGDVLDRNDRLIAHVHGTYASDGRLAHSTFGGRPLDTEMMRLIPGVRAGVEGMRPGGIRRLWVPWQEAYGMTGRPHPDNPAEGIPPQADFVFYIELIDVFKPPARD